MSKLPFDKQVVVVGALCEGLSIRSVERLIGIHRDTIMRLGARVGRGCERIHASYMHDLQCSVIELDELWAFVGKKQRKKTAEDPPELGDNYTFIALDSINKAIVAYRTGKRDQLTTERFLADLRARVISKPTISSDGFHMYENAIRLIWGRWVQYGQVQKQYWGEPAIDAARRYSPGRVVGIEKHQIIGEPPLAGICTSHVERVNLTVRMSQRRFTRLTNGYSKRIENHTAAVSLYVCHYNFCRVHEALRVTPAMALGVTHKVWSIAELLDGALHGYVESRLKRTVGFWLPNDGS